MADPEEKEETEEKHIRDYDMQLLINSNPNIVTVIDPRSYTCLYQNQTGIDMIGDIKGKTCYDNIPKQPNVCPFCKMQDAIETGKTTSSEVQMPDDSWLLVQFSPVRKEGGEIDIVETITNITEQKGREEELKKTVDVLIERESVIEKLREQLKGAGVDPEA